MDYSKPIKIEQGQQVTSVHVPKSGNGVWRLYLGISLILLSLILLAVSSLATSATISSDDAQTWIAAGIDSTAVLAASNIFFLVGFGFLLLMIVALRLQSGNMLSQAASAPASSGTTVYKFKPKSVRKFPQPAPVVDELTGLMNVRKFREELQTRLNNSLKQMDQTCVITIDLDHFTEFNHYYGRAAGDHLLCAVARLLGRLVASHGGQMARYGGEEFIAYLPGMCAEEGKDFATRLRRAVISLEFEKPKPARGFVTASFGVASATPSDGADCSALLEAADRALYLAKKNGRNRVESWPVLKASYSVSNIQELALRAASY